MPDYAVVAFEMSVEDHAETRLITEKDKALQDSNLTYAQGKITNYETKKTTLEGNKTKFFALIDLKKEYEENKKMKKEERITAAMELLKELFPQNQTITSNYTELTTFKLTTSTSNRVENIIKTLDPTKLFTDAVALINKDIETQKTAERKLLRTAKDNVREDIYKIQKTMKEMAEFLNKKQPGKFQANL